MTGQHTGTWKVGTLSTGEVLRIPDKSTLALPPAGPEQTALTLDKPS